MLKLNKVLLITSGAYANAEITSDFGLIPSAFLPIGHKRLFEYQINNIANFDCKKVIILPEDYVLLKKDSYFLSKNNVIIHRNNPNLNLAQSILNFLNFYEEKSTHIDELYILHGDTSFNEIAQETDLLYYGFTDTFYKWGHLSDIINERINCNTHKKPVIAGYFSFSKPAQFKVALEKTNSFELALKNYNLKQKFKISLKFGWLDFGHSNLYYKSKMELNVARNFNEVIANKNYLIKSSSNLNKIKSEFEWYMQLPENFKVYVPNVWGFEKKEKTSYKIEFIGAPTLQEKWVFGNLPDFVYYGIFDQIFEFLKKTKTIIFNEFDSKNVIKHLEDLYVLKTINRVNEFSNQIGLDLNKSVFINGKKYPTLNEFVLSINNSINEKLKKDKNPTLTLMHGDLCFSNILYDNRNDSLKFIDPRGGLDNNFNAKNKIIGDYKYDIAKIGHSIIGNYDYIVTGFYNLSKNYETLDFRFSLQHKTRKVFREYFYKKSEELGVSKDFIKASIVNLFISMLPLHSEDEDRQIALLLNAYQLYYD